MNGNSPNKSSVSVEIDIAHSQCFRQAPGHFISTFSDGYKFYRSSNNVILTPGNSEGLLPPKYFAKVAQVKPKKVIYEKEDKG